MTLWDAPIDAGRCYNFIPRVLRFDSLILAVPLSGASSRPVVNASSGESEREAVS